MDRFIKQLLGGSSEKREKRKLPEWAKYSIVPKVVKDIIKENGPVEKSARVLVIGTNFEDHVDEVVSSLPSLLSKNIANPEIIDTNMADVIAYRFFNLKVPHYDENPGVTISGESGGIINTVPTCVFVGNYIRGRELWGANYRYTQTIDENLEFGQGNALILN